MGRIARLALAAAVLAGGTAITLPTVAAPTAAASTSTARPARPPDLPPVPSVDPASSSLSPGGRALLEQASLADAPRYALSARIDPVAGTVDGRMHARVHRPKRGDLAFRVLAGLPALHTGLQVREVVVDGKSARPRLDRALLRVPAKHTGTAAADVRLRFSYRVPVAGTTRGRPLTQATIALLSRHGAVSLFGHWFPVWLPPGADTDPGLSGFGDIANFAAGAITARVDVPTGDDVVSGGVTVDRRERSGRTTVTEAGVGLRDLSLVVGRDLHSASAPAGDVTVRVTGPANVDVDGAARASADDLQTLAGLYGPYPWSEVDVVAVSLGPGVGGMEWPGVVWIGGLEQGPGGETALATAHELAHQWWHALVGNDSIRAPVVDEPLAQFSMCLVAAQLHFAGTECDGFGLGGAGGEPGASCADRPTTAFRTADQYGTLIYEQAPGFYTALVGAAGLDETVNALRTVVARHAFGIVTAAQLRDELAAALPDHAGEVRDLWDRYIGAPGCGVQTPRA